MHMAGTPRQGKGRAWLKTGNPNYPKGRLWCIHLCTYEKPGLARNMLPDWKCQLHTALFKLLVLSSSPQLCYKET